MARQYEDSTGDSWTAEQRPRIKDEFVLSKRIVKPFKPGTVPDEIIEKIAETVAENSGDC
jgi:cell division control protein 6